MRKIRDLRRMTVEHPRESGDSLMRQPKKFLEQSQLVHQLERGGMNRVAAEIAVEIPMLFQDDNLHARAGQQVTGHHSGRPATDDYATCADRGTGGRKSQIRGQWEEG